MKKMIIKADYNDADYVHSINFISDGDIENIKDFLKELKENNGSYEQEYDSESFEIFDSYVPYPPDASNIHTIESVTILDIISEEKLF